MLAPCSINGWADQEAALALDADVAEMSLLLTTRQAAALETAAHQCGLTAAQMIRRLIEDFILRDTLLSSGGARFSLPSRE